MTKIHKLVMKWGTFVAAGALMIATSSVGTTCYFTAYQPELPEQLKKHS